MSELEEIKRILERERMARREAERILEEKSLEIFEQKQEIEQLRKNLIQESERRTSRLNRTQQLFADVFYKHPFSIIVYDPANLLILDVNIKATQLYGYSTAEFKGMRLTDLHAPEERRAVEKIIARLLPDEITSGTWEHFRKDGSVCHVRITGAPVDYFDRPSRIVIIEDISETLALQRSRDEERRKYIDLVEKSSDLIFRVSPEGKFIYVNKATCNVTGFSEEDLLSMSFRNLVQSDYVKRVTAFYLFQLESGTPNTYTEFPIRTRDGTEIWMGQNVDIYVGTDGEMEIIAVAREITERKVLEKALLRSEEKFRSIIENMELGLLEVSNGGIILKAYPTFCKIVGYTPDELEGTSGLFMLDAEGIAVMNRELDNRMRGLSSLYEIELIAKDGSRRWVLISGAPYYDEKNRIAGTIGIHLDITERKRMEAELRQATDVAEASLKAKELFLANISHEIRTPLNAIIGLSGLLQESGLSDQQREMSETIGTASQNLLDLINDILLLSKVEIGGIELREAWHSLPDVCADAFVLFEETARNKGIGYVRDVQCPPSRRHYVDRLRLMQIVQNLLSNAVKFTEKGEVSLQLELREQEGEDDVRIEIRDSGIGIPESELEHIFQDFSQASNNRPEKYGGTGLGLSIVSKLVRIMQGEIEVESGPAGTVFRLRLRLQRAESDANEEKQESDDVKGQFRGLKVLVAEDNSVNQLLIQKIMEQWQCDFEIVENGALALKALEEQEFDLVLMDIRMPVMDGLEASRLIRDELRIDRVPVIALTAHAFAGDEVRYFEAGMNAVVGKPFRPEELVGAIRHCRETVPRDIAQRLKNIAPGDPVFADTLREIFLTDSSARLEKIGVALEAQDMDQIARIVHSMKPSVHQLGDPHLVQLASHLQQEREWSPEAEEKARVFVRCIRILMKHLETPLV